jgi:ATP-binding cassette, subfamily B (MDR/TAP), member 1
LDSDSEMKIKEALNKAAVGRTTVIVAHRLSTIQNVDKIFVLKRGMVVEQGTHEELKTMRAVYWKMCQMQNIN